MKKKITIITRFGTYHYLKPEVRTGRNAAYNLVLAMEIETIFGNLGEVDSQNLTAVLDQLKNWLLFNCK